MSRKRSNGEAAIALWSKNRIGGAWTHLPDWVRFWQCVERRNCGCWGWSGFVNSYGYPIITMSNGRTGAHRLMWSLINGPIQSGLSVLHKCDNPICMNPDHLFIGTQADNMADMIMKGRKARGSKSPRAKATEEQVLRAHTMLNEGQLSRVVAESCGINLNTVYHIKQGTRWGWLTGRSVVAARAAVEGKSC